MTPSVSQIERPAAPGWKDWLTTAGRTVWSGSIPLSSWIGRTAALLLILFQCAVLYWVVRRFQIETELFRLIVSVALAGFLIHHFLPMRFRLPFFLALSVGLITVCLGLEQGKWNPLSSLQRAGTLFAAGFLVIGICRLPLAFAYRVGLLAAAGAVLAVFRGGWLSFGPLEAIWPVLGGMFMYRTAGYLYDLEHEKQKSTLVQACSYFFLFPNVWLFVFPVIDYKTFLKTYFNGETLAIYQRGLAWMMRGVVQLLIWRFLYYQVYIDPARISNGTDLIQFLLGNVGMYLHVTGQFHFAIGLLHLFGFHLPETNRRYFLASDFVDYWRRANIYMKDFLMKLCYYPLVVRFKKLGPAGSVAAAIAGTFVVTWLLHPYQWFWIRGVFPLTPKDALFWGLLGVGVIVVSVRDIRKKPQPAAVRNSWSAAARTSLSTAGTFAATTLLWSIWSCDSLEQWAGIWRFADAATVGYAAAALAAVMAAYLLLESRVRPWRGASPQPQGSTPGFAWRPAVWACLAPAAVLIAGTTDAAFARMRADHKDIVKSLFWNTPNKSGQDYLVRGYYENLIDVNRVSPLLEGALESQPSTWQLLEDTPAVRETPNLRTRELVPSQNLTINSVAFTTNSAGLRDQEYALEKPAGVTRIAVLGSSIAMGWNVPHEQTFEALIEQELNQASPGRYEVLNFAVNGYSIVSLVEQFEAQVARFRPDIVMVVSHPEDPSRASYMLAKSIAMGAPIEYPYLRGILDQAGVSPGDPRNRIERKLSPYEMDLTRWSYESLVRLAQQHGARPWLVYLPGVLQRSIEQIDRDLVAYAQQAGFEVIPLLEVYAAEEDRAALAVAAWDAHPNARGHQMIAAELLRQVRQRRLLPQE